MNEEPACAGQCLREYGELGRGQLKAQIAALPNKVRSADEAENNVLGFRQFSLRRLHRVQAS
jgi:hypothetical protein